MSDTNSATEDTATEAAQAVEAASSPEAAASAAKSITQSITDGASSLSSKAGAMAKAEGDKLTAAASHAYETGTTLLTEYGFSVLGAIGILIIGRIIAGWVSRTVDKFVTRSKRIDNTLKPLLVSIARWLVMIVTILAVLNQFGVQTASVIALLGAAGLAVGLALQGTLSNVAAGVMLLILRPFQVGDYISVNKDQVAGTVRRIDLFTSELKTPNGEFVSVPNGQIWGQTITNFNRNPIRRIDLTIGIDYEDDIGKARDIIMGVLKAESRILPDPEPVVAVKALGASSVDFAVRHWVNKGDYWDGTFHLNRTIKEELDKGGITIPFPQTVITQRQAA
ncbi:MAG: small-conductance mechanosensitive channel MscS [Alphaproteobacteria bacterium]